MLTIHGRTRKEMSEAPVHWDAVNRVRELRDRIAPQTVIVGNGDVATLAEARELAVTYKLDGIMIGRGIFHDPFIFDPNSPWQTYTKEQKLDLYAKHVKLFADTWQNSERRIATLNKFCKVYINGFDGAKELREQLMAASTADELLGMLANAH
jgi:tRNA-dihydrouridine synthase